MKETILCPQCGHRRSLWKNPVPTVDIIIHIGDKIVLIERKNEPFGWAIPGGFVDYGESFETTAMREAEEETGLRVKNLKQFRCYSDPQRDPRQHTVTCVFTAEAEGTPVAGDDAVNAVLFALDNLPENLCFDHGEILADYLQNEQLSLNGDKL